MIAYADTSFLVSLYAPDSNSAEAQAIARGPVWLTPFGELEFRNAIELRVFRREITSDQAGASLRAFDADIGPFFHRVPMPSAVYERALALAARETRRTGARSLDILHVAVSLELAADLFLTFDPRQKKLAHSAGLKTRP